MKKVEHTPDTLPPLTEAQRNDIARLAEVADHEINTGDMPELTAQQLAGMRKGVFYRPVKQQITARVDSDVLAWLKAGGEKGYQTRMNAILRRAMLNAR